MEGIVVRALGRGWVGSAEGEVRHGEIGEFFRAGRCRRSERDETAAVAAAALRDPAWPIQRFPNPYRIRRIRFVVEHWNTPRVSKRTDKLFPSAHAEPARIERVRVRSAPPQTPVAAKCHADPGDHNGKFRAWTAAS